jgi:6-pyruvoyltetrahydropterin/6-carboxytetrahydropterin synthase
MDRLLGLISATSTLSALSAVNSQELVLAYRVCKSFEIESGHMLSKHPGLCRFPHGHTRRVDVVLAAERLDERDMICDFKVIKLALEAFLARFDHAMAMNSGDPALATLDPAVRERIVTFENADPTTEVLAKHFFDHIAAEIGAGRGYADERGHRYRFPGGLKVERVRVTETSSTWAEYGVE